MKKNNSWLARQLINRAAVFRKWCQFFACAWRETLQKKLSHVCMYDVAQWEYDSTERQKDGVGYDNEQMGSEWSREYGGYKIRRVKARDK